MASETTTTTLASQRAAAVNLKLSMARLCRQASVIHVAHMDAWRVAYDACRADRTPEALAAHEEALQANQAWSDVVNSIGQVIRQVHALLGEEV